MNTIDELFNNFKQITKGLNDKQQYEALDVLFSSYEEHKKINGSCAFIHGEEYQTKMKERRQYQLNMVKNYVERLKK